MEKNDEFISRRDALKRLLAGAVGVAGLCCGLPACRNGFRDEGSRSRETGSVDPIPCIGCGKCMPCPYGVDIPLNFEVYNQAVSWQELPDPREAGQPRYQEKRRRFLTDYANRIPHLQRADHCIGCGKCLPACPQHLDIDSRLRQIDMLVEGLKTH